MTKIKDKLKTKKQKAKKFIYFLSLLTLNKHDNITSTFNKPMIIKYLNIYVVFSCLLLSLGSCKNTSPTHRTVTVSILPQKYLTERIAGDYLDVNVMIPPGMNPATCDLNTEQLKKLYDSDLCFTIGYLPFELTHLYPVLESRKDIRVINHSKGLPLLSGSCSHHHHEGEEHEGVDPHIWLSLKNVKTMTDTIYQVLAERYPEQQETFKTNYKLLSQEIDSIARKANQVFENRQDNKTFLIYHPALTYFAADYGLEQISIEDEGKEPNPAHLKKTIDLAREKNIHMIFIQSQFDVNNAKAIAREIGARIIPIDPLSENWKEEMVKLIGIFEGEEIRD